MSNEVLNWAKRVVVGGQTRKAVFLLLADYADDKGRAWPSQETIAETLEMSERTVRSCIAALVDDGLLSRKQRWRPDGTRGTDILKFDMELVNRQEIPVNGEQPANDGRTTGKSRRNNRQMPPEQPAGDAALEPSLEPSLDPSLNVSEATASGRPAFAEQPADLSDKDRLWAEGRPSLVECGLSHKQAGDMIGRWLATYRDPVAILAAIWAARTEGTQSAIPYVIAILEAPDRKARASPRSKPKTAGAFYADLANGVFSGGYDDERSEAQPPQLRLIAGSRH